MAGLVADVAFVFNGALSTERTHMTNNHLDLNRFPMLRSFSGFSQKKSSSHDDLRIAPSFLILNAASHPLNLVGA
jgi:hypothetical protein